jgi:hypothetical protein
VFYEFLEEAQGTRHFLNINEMVMTTYAMMTIISELVQILLPCGPLNVNRRFGNSISSPSSGPKNKPNKILARKQVSSRALFATSSVYSWTLKTETIFSIGT